jgi:hypothetical protein
MVASTFGRPRWFALLLALACTHGSCVQLSGQTAVPASQRVPVLVELFTSEGCSSCPPADDLLQELDAGQPVPGAEAIVLSEHVTYWNHDGWRDPFSLDAMTERQEDYQRRFGLDSSYTPQMVVDGKSQFVGSNAKALIAAVAKEAKTPKQPLTIEGARWDHGSAVFSVHSDVSVRAKLYAVLAEDATHSQVTRGENAGRTLHHTAVVRAMKEYSLKDATGSLLKIQGGTPVLADGAVRLIVFLVDPGTGHVVGAAEQTLRR